ncbi:MAG TPA: hypothetical protein VN926_15175 [Bradyrhizobium sp.]|jgi:hypothetical protein|nr:hypothetical protein [Bradyrhizobium sp.]
MVRPFRHPVNAADRPQGALRAERRITVKAINLLRAIIKASRRLPAAQHPVAFGGMHLPVAAG